MSGYHYEYFPPSRPREAKGGIKAQSRRGGFTESWWATRWIEVLESFNIGARLARGRTYARRGQVLSISVKKGLVEAAVQGSRSAPYRVSIKVKKIKRTDWTRIADEVSGQAFMGAKLLSGEMPPEIEDLFAGLGLSLFPGKYKDLATECSCPDWSNPCKHVAAVYYLLGEEFDRDPFLIFKLRGIEGEAFIELVNSTERASAPGRGKSAGNVVETDPTPVEPLSTDSRLFWTGATLPADFFGEVAPPPEPGPLATSLGRFPFWRGETRFSEFLDDVYLAGSDSGMEAFLNASR